MDIIIPNKSGFGVKIILRNAKSMNRKNIEKLRITCNEIKEDEGFGFMKELIIGACICEI